MFGSKIEKAKSEWPVDRINLKKGYVSIVGQYPDPKTENKAMWSGVLVTVVTIPFLLFFAPVLGVMAGFAAWSLFKRGLNIRIGPEEVRVNGKRYALENVREFRVEPHQRAYRPNPGVYTRAIEVVMQYGEKRITIAEMRQKDEEKAVALALRLQNWCEKFEEMVALARQKAQQDAEPAKGDFGPSPDIR